MSDDRHERLPLDGWHRARGARMVPFAGYAMPIQYEGIIAEHRWTRASAGPVRRQPYGPADRRRRRGARRALEALLPGRSRHRCKEGRLRYSLLLNDEGGIIDDLMVTRRGDHFYLVVNGATKEGDIAHLEARLPRGVVARSYEGAGAAGAAGAEGGRRARPARARASRSSAS